MENQGDTYGNNPNATIEDLYLEERVFPPSKEFKSQALVSDNSLYEQADQDYEGFWANQAKELDWFQQWDTILDWQLPFAKWFIGGKLNASYNCVDRHVEAGKGDKVAFYWEAEAGESKTITYAELLTQVSTFANVLKKLGITKGDLVSIYMPMIPETVVAMLACSRIGAAHSVIFGGFSSDALKDRINDASSKVLITSDGSWRRGKVVPLKQNADVAVEGAPCIEHVVVVKRTESNIEMKDGRDLWWHDLIKEVDTVCEPVPMDAEDLLFLLYTSGTTAKPKGIMHTTGGYLTQVGFTTHYVFDLHPEKDIYWCAADVGWITGHSYIVYGPLLNGATSVIYEGSPDYPDLDRWWEIVERYKVSILYTAPTAIRMFMKWGDKYPKSHDLSSLRVLASVGEPINPEAWMWYHEVIGGNNCPISDTWWQTETGSHMVAPLPGVVALKPGSATFPLPGIAAEVVDESGNKIEHGGGYLTITKPWPSMMRGIFGEPERYFQTYWSRFEGRYFAGDGAKIDADGYFWLLGRVDDVMNISGHRVSTTEVESAIVNHHGVAEAAVVGAKDSLSGQAIIAFVILRTGVEPSVEFGEELRDLVGRSIGPIAKPKKIIFTPELPKTRSGKIMRRLLKDVVEGRALGDTTTLADDSVVAQISTLSNVRSEEE